MAVAVCSRLAVGGDVGIQPVLLAFLDVGGAAAGNAGVKLLVLAMTRSSIG